MISAYDRHRQRQRLLALGLGLLPLLMAECGLRWWVGSRVYEEGVVGEGMVFDHSEGLDDLVLFTPDPDLLWRYRRGVRVKFHDYTIETTRHGFRSTPHTVDHGDPLRVVTLGDSRTMGAGVEADEMYSAILELLLEKRLGRAVDVRDLGVDGYSTFHGQRLGELELPRLRPDVVTAAYDVNDAAQDSSRGHAERAATIGRAQVVVHDWLNRSMLFFWARRAALSFTRDGRGPGEGALVSNVGMDDYATNLRIMASQATEGGWTLLVLRIPLRTNLWPTPDDEISERSARYAETARLASSEVGIPWVDTAPALLEVPREGGWVGDVHPACAGHVAIAETLAEAIAAKEGAGY